MATWPGARIGSIAGRWSTLARQSRRICSAILRGRLKAAGLLRLARCVCCAPPWRVSLAMPKVTRRLGFGFVRLRSWSAARPFCGAIWFLNPSGRRAAQTLERSVTRMAMGENIQKRTCNSCACLTLRPSRFLALLPHISNAALSRPLTPKTEQLARVALVAHPGNSVIYKNFGGVISAAGHFELSARSTRRASSSIRKSINASDLGTYMLPAGRPFAAWAYFEAAVAACPDNEEAEFNAQRHGWRWATIWAGSGASRAMAAEHHRCVLSTLSRSRLADLPVWQNQPIDGKRFFVWGEQGIGDDIWFAGRLNDFVAAGAEVVLECSPKLVALMARSFPQIDRPGAYSGPVWIYAVSTINCRLVF